MAESFSSNSESYDRHVNRSSCVRYYYGRLTEFLRIAKEDALYVGRDFLKRNSDEHFKNFFTNAKNSYNKGYRAYMRQLFRRNIVYKNMPEKEASSSSLDISIQTSDIAHAFGLPSLLSGNSTERAFVEKQLVKFFDEIVTTDDGKFIIKKDANGKNYDMLPNFSLNLKEFNGENFDAIRDYVNEAVNEITRAVKELNMLTGPNEMLANNLNEKLNAIGNIIFNGSGDNNPSLVYLCDKYKDVKVINSFLLDAILICSQAYNDLLKFRNDLVFSYNLKKKEVYSTDFFENWMVSELLEMAKRSPQNLKQLLLSFNNENIFMKLVTPCIIKVNNLFATNASLDVIENRVRELYPRIISQIKDNMEKLCIKSKYNSEIKVSGTLDEAIKDEELVSSYQVSNSLKRHFQEFCERAGLNDNEFFENVEYYYSDNNNISNFSIEDWQFLIVTYQSLENEYIIPISNKIDSIYEQLYDKVDENEIDRLEKELSVLEKEQKKYELIKESLLNILSDNIEYYNEILKSRLIVRDLNSEIDKFVRSSKPELKGKSNQEKYPMLYYFFNSKSMPLYDEFDYYKTYGGRTHDEIDKIFQRNTDKLFEKEEELRRYIFVEDLENMINEIQNLYGSNMSKNDLLKILVNELVKKYDFPYIFKIMMDSPYMIENVFKQDFINGNPTFNWRRIQDKAKVAAKLSYSLIESPMIRRIDGEIMSDFIKDKNVVKNATGYQKDLKHMIGYIFQVPSEYDKADLVFIEPIITSSYGNYTIKTDSNGRYLFRISHLFLNQELAKKYVSVIARHKDGTYGFEQFNVGEGHIVSYAVKKVKSDQKVISSFNSRDFFPKTFDAFLDDYRATDEGSLIPKKVEIDDIPDEDKSLFELMRSSHQLVVEGNTVFDYLERAELLKKYQDYIHEYTKG